MPNKKKRQKIEQQSQNAKITSPAPAKPQTDRNAQSALSTRTKAVSIVAEALALTLLALYPLYLNSERYVALVQHKVYFFWLFMGLFSAAFIVVWLSFIGLVKASDKSPWYRLYNAADWAALAYFLCILVSCFSSPLTSSDLGTSRFMYFLQGNLHVAMWRYEGVLTKGFYLLTYVLISRLFIPKQRDWIVFGVSANILALIGFFQFIGMDFLNLFPYEAQGMTHPYASLDIIFRTTLGNVDILSAYVGLVIPFFAVMYCKGANNWRFLYLSAVITNFMLMILGGADGGKVGVLAGLLAVVVIIVTDRTALSRLFLSLGISCLSCLFIDAAYAARDYFWRTGETHIFIWSDTFSSLWLWVGIATLLLALAIKFLPIPFNPEKKRLASLVATAVILLVGIAGVELVGTRVDDHENIIYQAREVMHGNLEDQFGSWRGLVWKRSIPVIMTTPLFGTGPDTFGYAFLPYQGEAYLMTNTTFDKAHNEVLETAVCSGLLGMAAYLALCIFVAIKGLPKLLNSVWLMAAWTASLGFFVQSLFGVSVPLVTPLFYLMMGVVVKMSSCDIYEDGVQV